MTTRTGGRDRVGDPLRRLLAEMQKQTQLLREIRDLLRDDDEDAMSVTIRLDDEEPIPFRRHKP